MGCLRKENAMRTAIWKTLALIAIVAMLGACSKGGVGNGDGTSPASGNWDSLTWDQGSWS